MTQTRQQICLSCELFIRKLALCKFYLRRCSTKKLWTGQIDPPEQCPKYDLVESADCDPPEKPSP